MCCSAAVLPCCRHRSTAARKHTVTLFLAFLAGISILLFLPIRAIVPGIEISLDALFGRAAGLRRVELVEPQHVIGKSTVESIQSGVIYGFSGQVDALVDRFLVEVGDATVLGTGGLAELIGPHTRNVQRYEPWLTLYGLRIVFERNQ